VAKAFAAAVAFFFAFSIMKPEALLYTFVALVSIFEGAGVNFDPSFRLEDATGELEKAQQARRLVEQEVCKPPVPPGAFPPVITYKYLKTPPALIYTASKDTMGGNILFLRHAAVPMPGSMFDCSIEGGEWKARVRDPRANVLTLELNRGMGDPSDLTSMCLLQDISLHRSADRLALRLDYGYCPKPATEETQAFILLGLQIVPNSPIFADKTPGIKDFFAGICTSPVNKNVVLDLNKAQAYHDYATGYKGNTCFAGSADLLKMASATRPKCWDTATAYTMLNPDDDFGVLPITESDYAWLSNQIPASPPDSASFRTYGEVTVDRACVFFDGIKTHSGQDCNNGCGKWCSSREDR
jgi:hypothetical protein